MAAKRHRPTYRDSYQQTLSLLCGCGCELHYRPDSPHLKPAAPPPVVSPAPVQPPKRYRCPPRAGKLKGSGFMLADPCAYCGAPSTDFDHIEPIHRGGRNRLDNLTRACYRCNNSKRTKPLLVWLALQAASRQHSDT